MVPDIELLASWQVVRSVSKPNWVGMVPVKFPSSYSILVVAVGSVAGTQLYPARVSQHGAPIPSFPVPPCQPPDTDAESVATSSGIASQPQSWFEKR